VLRLLIALILSVSSSLLVRAEAIETYHTTLTVRPSGGLHITEMIEYDFGSLQRHGIFRDIPLTVKIDRIAPETPIGLSNFTVSVDGRPVPFSSHEIASKSSGKMLRYRIGDPHKTLTRKHTYRLEYRAKRGVFPSPLSGMNAIRWNAVGAGSNVPTQHAVADLILPEVLDRSQVRIRVYTGRYGSTNSRASFNWIDDHHVRFKVSDLAPHEALTVEANYPKGVLGQSTEAPQSTWSDRLLSNWHWGGLAGFFLFLWSYARQFGTEDRARSVPPQYYPPRGLSLLQSGLILDKFADKKDFSAAILELGTLGLLEVHQSKGDTTPIIRRTDKPTETADLTEDQLYMLDHILFKNSDTYVIKTQDASRAERINAQLDRVNEMLYTWSVADGLMRANPKRTRRRFLVRVGIVAGLLALAAIVTTGIYYGLDLVIFTLVSGIFITVGIVILLSGIRGKTLVGKLFGGGWLLFSMIIFGTALSDEENLSHLFSSPMLLLFFVAGGTWYYYRRIGLFTPQGLETYRYLLGYSEFMKRVEQDRIRRFLAKDPEYLDKGLPYAVLFGHNKHWIGFYEALQISQPDWYYGDMHHMNAFTHSLESQRIAPASESGGFSGGGSFSGGGGGGGGVGSW
jgi:uncharacterized membrane protein YgcG